MIPEYLTRFPFDTSSIGHTKPSLFLDGVPYSISNLNSKLYGDIAYVLGVNQESFNRMVELVSAKVFQFEEMRVENIQKLTEHNEIEELAINWNTKLIEIAPISKLTNLKTIVFAHTPKVEDLTPIGKCSKLEILEFSGGMYSHNKVKSLKPLSNLESLRKLRLLNLKVLKDGLKPLSSLTSLKELVVSNQFPTEDYAFLSVKLTQTNCSHFQPYIKLSSAISEKDTMVVGSRKPFLNSKKDYLKLKRYEQDFEELRRRFS